MFSNLSKILQSIETQPFLRDIYRARTTINTRILLLAILFLRPVVFPTSYLRSSRIPYLPPGYYLFIIYLLITLYFYQLVAKRRKKIVHHQSSRFFLLDNSIEERAESIVFKIFHEITYL